jgi:hypothetical protein
LASRQGIPRLGLAARYGQKAAKVLVAIRLELPQADSLEPRLVFDQPWRVPLPSVR